MPDLPRKEILALAQRTLDHLALTGREGTVHFKFTCPACGTRCTFQEPNVLREFGECMACQYVSPVLEAGMLLLVTELKKPNVG